MASKKEKTPISVEREFLNCYESDPLNVKIKELYEHFKEASGVNDIPKSDTSTVNEANCWPLSFVDHINTIFKISKVNTRNVRIWGS